MKDVFIFGDSIAYGLWDEQGGWAQRIRSSNDQSFVSNRGTRTYFYNLGIPGDTMQEILGRLEDEIKARYKKNHDTLVLFAAGINDSHIVTSTKEPKFKPAQFEKNVSEVADIAAKFTLKIGFIGLNPVDEAKVTPLSWNPEKSYSNERIKLFNDIIRSVAERRGFFFGDVWNQWMRRDYKALLFDGIHPNASGHRRIAEKANPFLQDMRYI